MPATVGWHLEAFRHSKRTRASRRKKRSIFSTKFRLFSRRVNQPSPFTEIPGLLDSPSADNEKCVSPNTFNQHT